MATSSSEDNVNDARRALGDADHEAERQHYMEVRASFVEYILYSQGEVFRLQRHLQLLSESLFNRLDPDLIANKLQGIAEGAMANQRFFDAVINYQDHYGRFPVSDAMRDLVRVRASTGSPTTSASNRSKINSTLHQVVREWSSEGKEERAQSYGVLVDELCQWLPINDRNRNKVKVLVPGAGLGRLVLEIASRGYDCQGNEFSYFMLFVSNFVLNILSEVESCPVAAFIDSSCNQLTVADMVRQVRIPDVSAVHLMDQAREKLRPGEEPGFSMSAGEWLEIYGDQEGEWDAVVTCFFLDTAPVVMEYIETIYSILKPGGVWINIGPLLYHWAGGVDAGETDERFHQSIELSYEEVRHLITGYGFDLVKEELRDCNYTRNVKSMMYTSYKVMHFTAVKPPDTGGSPAGVGGSGSTPADGKK